MLAQPPHGHECEWHEHRPDLEDVNIDGAWHPEMEAWFSHLRSTLYLSDGRPLDALEGKIRPNWERIDVTACKSQASRFFRVSCKQCNQYSYGQYGSWALQTGVDTEERCRDDLAKFFKLQGVPSGKPQV